MINLETGANVSLTKNNPLLNNLLIGLGWSITQPTGPQVELVASALICHGHNVISDKHVVFFNQLTTPDNAVIYVENPDNVEELEVTLNLIPDEVTNIVFLIYVNPDLRKPGNFSTVKNAFISVSDREGNGIVKYSIPSNPTGYNVTAMAFGELYKHKDEWKFRALGQGYDTGLLGVSQDYGFGV